MEGLAEAKVEVMDVLGCEESDSGVVVPERHRFRIQGGLRSVRR